MWDGLDEAAPVPKHRTLVPAVRDASTSAASLPLSRIAGEGTAVGRYR
jgi:hypothetical protein